MFIVINYPMPKAKKPDKILTGLRELCAEQTPGRTYTPQEIAARCDCSYERIGQIERQALGRMKKRMQKYTKELEA